MPFFFDDDYPFIIKPILTFNIYFSTTHILHQTITMITKGPYTNRSSRYFGNDIDTIIFILSGLVKYATDLKLHTLQSIIIRDANSSGIVVHNTYSRKLRKLVYDIPKFQ